MASTTDVIEALKYTYGVDQVLYLAIARHRDGCSRSSRSRWVVVGSSLCPS